MSVILFQVNKFHVCIMFAVFMVYLYLHYYYVAEGKNSVLYCITLIVHIFNFVLQ